MTYEVIILGHLHMPLYFIGTFTEYSYLVLLYKVPWYFLLKNGSGKLEKALVPEL